MRMQILLALHVIQTRTQAAELFARNFVRPFDIDQMRFRGRMKWNHLAATEEIAPVDFNQPRHRHLQRIVVLGLTGRMQCIHGPGRQFLRKHEFPFGHVPVRGAIQALLQSLATDNALLPTGSSPSGVSNLSTSKSGSSPDPFRCCSALRKAS